ncbi:TPA: hypothetical protein ACITB6_004553, partial [Salmonella enterica subsp. enterica serovar Virchow]
PSPRAEPVTSAVFPVKSNKAVMLFPHLFNLYDDYPFFRLDFRPDKINSSPMNLQQGSQTAPHSDRVININ